MMIMNPFHSQFDYARAYEVPPAKADQLESFLKMLCAYMSEDRADVFSRLLLWVRCGMPARLVSMGMSDESALVFANGILEKQVKIVTGLHLFEIAQAIDADMGINSRALLLSTELLTCLCDNLEFLARQVELFTYNHPDICARVEVLEQLIDQCGHFIELTVNPYVTSKVYAAVKSRWLVE